MAGNDIEVQRPLQAGTPRRSFVNWLLGTSFGALLLSALYPVMRFITPPEIAEPDTNQIDAGPANDPKLVEKGFKIVRFGADPVILLRLSETDHRAFSAVCTHLDCIVDYRKDVNLIWCWCHNGIYDLTGRNIGGPPPRPLTPFRVNLVTSKRSDVPAVIISKT